MNQPRPFRKTKKHTAEGDQSKATGSDNKTNCECTIEIQKLQLRKVRPKKEKEIAARKSIRFI